MIVLIILAFNTLVGIACNDNPCANGTACGITAPRNDDSVTQKIINWAQETDPDGSSNDW
jgi:hypothetical protein